MIKKKVDRSLAERAAEKILKESKIKNYPPVVLRDIVEYLKSFKDIDVRSRNMSENFSGMLIIKENTFGILYNENFNENRNRFTVAHEIGHLMLGHEFDEEIIYEKRDITSQKDWWEQEANAFAASLLMPKKCLKIDLRNLNKGKIPLLAKKYRVSETAMRNRIFYSNGLLDSTYIPFYNNEKNELEDII